MHKFSIWNAQFLLFVAGGSICALIDIGLMQLLIAAKTTVLQATSAGFAAGLVVNYAFHAKLTFKKLSTHATLLRFLCLLGINYLMTLAFVGAALSLFDNALIGKLLSLPAVAVNGFWLSKHWIFK